jgi:hypothetical protein
MDSANFKIYCDVRLESCNLHIRWAELRETRSRGNTTSLLWVWIEYLETYPW